MKLRLHIILSFFILSSSLGAQDIKLVFRYDDYTLKNDSINEEVVRLFKKHHVPLVLGVIPCDSKEKMILQKDYALLTTLKIVVQNQTIEIAQHGLNHIKLANGEFGNVSFEEQMRRMQKGKTILDSIFNTKVTTFIPPWNAYDKNTLNVMQQLNFKGLSSALCIGQSFSNQSINYFPESTKDFNSLLSVLNHNKSRIGVVVVMFHHYSFGKNFSLNQLDSLLTKINKLSYVKCVTFSELYNSREVSDKMRMDANMESNLMSKWFHLNGVLQTTAFATFIRVINVLLYLVLSTLIYLLSIVLIYRKKQISNKKKYSFGLILLVFVGLIVWFHLLSPLKLVLFVVLISICFPLIFKIQYKR